MEDSTGRLKRGYKHISEPAVQHQLKELTYPPKYPPPCVDISLSARRTTEVSCRFNI